MGLPKTGGKRWNQRHAPFWRKGAGPKDVFTPPPIGGKPPPGVPPKNSHFFKGKPPVPKGVPQTPFVGPKGPKRGKTNEQPYKIFSHFLFSQKTPPKYHPPKPPPRPHDSAINNNILGTNLFSQPKPRGKKLSRWKKFCLPQPPPRGGEKGESTWEGIPKGEKPGPPFPKKGIGEVSPLNFCKWIPPHQNQ